MGYVNLTYVSYMSYVNNMTYVNDMSYVKLHEFIHELCGLCEYFYESLKIK